MRRKWLHRPPWNTGWPLTFSLTSTSTCMYHRTAGGKLQWEVCIHVKSRKCKWGEAKSKAAELLRPRLLAVFLEAWSVLRRTRVVRRAQVGEIGKCLFKSYFGFKDRWGNLPSFFPCSLLMSNNLGEEVGILSDEIEKNVEHKREVHTPKFKKY